MCNHDFINYSNKLIVETVNLEKCYKKRNPKYNILGIYSKFRCKNIVNVF